MLCATPGFRAIPSGAPARSERDHAGQFGMLRAVDDRGLTTLAQAGDDDAARSGGTQCCDRGINLAQAVGEGRIVDTTICPAHGRRLDHVAGAAQRLQE